MKVTIENISTEKYYSYKNNEQFGKVVAGSLDMGDYGFCPMVNMLRADGSIFFSAAINNLTEISFDEYVDYVELSTGVTPVN